MAEVSVPDLNSFSASLGVVSRLEAPFDRAAATRLAFFSLPNGAASR